ncbi:hypothetical protein PF005_g7839 [Phytophthora fragariae]|uniref:Uncharacterized protein n=1 Tax=Phytophthora fragariae TaxID=53985 RepID=A0A6A3LLP7_9STRA|nr:hypothetical protein PF003_g7381 [Phytophthora fragariae]KAE8941613.1 hypothetical protein PF009_g8590 [Phytophthora fragariae]KAE9017054.1 hypothetical protein PF011_g6869 [Phytophthora fragariae]KAE9071220.1 hypothetical protein PF010_g25956 [Phytophthora fragariae]KAE9119733.1 hypothetical protein PF007_g8441 [Phytophthora fragariae]
MTEVVELIFLYTREIKSRGFTEIRKHLPDLYPESAPRCFICDPDRKDALEPVASSN